MNYSRRQLEALGETLGECVTRKEGGRIIYGGGGSGGGSSTSTQTQITELPEWARPTAQRTLANAEALSQAPYQAYGQPRIAGFSPLQLQAQETAAGMRPSQLGQQAGQMAGAATLGALGTQYDPFQMGQFTSGAAAQYMNPFVEQAMAPQLREAQRASEIQGQTEQAQATRAGAFGGSRQAIVEAERQRNLGQQLGDIRARGYMSAFDRAQDQFAREQALREQSRQYGAGLELQGLQTALQGAGQMGALGQQQFGQEMDINRLQQQTGAQQQALRQQGLTQAYQDFMEEKNYPFKQLAFMSDMIRGLPLGQQSSRQIYEPPGSMVGQLGGLGMGLYGMSRAFGGFAEGGEVEEYADGGGIDDPDNVAKIVGSLSDAQLAQAKQAALVRGDKDQLDAIQTEESMRASERRGMASAFNQLPYEQQERMMAGGGVVAFSDGGVSPEFDVGDPTAEGIRSVNPFDIGRLVRGGKSIEEYYGEPAFGSKAATPAAKDESYGALEQKRLEQPRPAPKSRPASQRQAAPISPAIRQGIEQIAEQTGQPKESLQSIFDSYRKALKEESTADMKELTALAEKAMGGSKAVKEQALGRALAEFGFKWAASAAKPGARFLGSAAEAAPTLAASAAESEKLAREMDQNDIKLRMTMKQFEIAQRKGDLATAASLARDERMLRQSQEQLELQRQQLEETKRANIAKERLTGQRYAASSAAVSDRMARVKSQLAMKAATEAKDYDDPLKGRALKSMYPSRQAYQKALFEQMWAQSMPLEYAGVKDSQED